MKIRPSRIAVPLTSPSSSGYGPSGNSTWADLLEIDWRPRYFDITFVTFAVIYYSLIQSTGLPLSVDLANVFVFSGVRLLLVVYGLAAGIVLIRLLSHLPSQGIRAQFQTNSLVNLLQPYFTLNFFLLTLRRILAIFGSIYFFLHLKHLILIIHPVNFDLTYWDLDRTLHFGIQPNIWAMETFGENHSLAILLDWLYIKYFTYKLIVAMVFLLEPRGRRLTDLFFFAYALLWAFGGLAYLVAPADGPCYAILSNYSVPTDEHRTHRFAYPVAPAPESYVEKYKNAKIYYAKFYQERLWSDRWAFLHSKKLPGVFYGIAAMPSLHVAAVTMLMIFLFRASVFGGLFGACYVASTFLGSIFLQWHYAIDGYIGALLGIVVSVIAFKSPDFWKD